jgi:hypothetical protein
MPEALRARVGMLATLLCVAAIFTVLPTVESNIMAEDATFTTFADHEALRIPDFVQSEDSLEEESIWHRPEELEMMQMVEEASDEVDEGEIQLGVETAMRNTVRRLISEATRHAMQHATQEGHANGLKGGHLQVFVQAAISRASMAVKDQLNSELVEQAAKTEAIKVAKQHAKAAAAAAASRGASRVEQAHAARSMASSVALAFARVARESGMRIANDEVELQSQSAVPFMGSQVSELASVGKTSSSVADEIEDTAAKGVADGVNKAKAVARKEAKKEGLNAAETKKLVKEAPDAVKDAADSLHAKPGSAPTGANSKQTKADTDAYSNGDTGKRISVDKAAQAGKEKAKKDVVKKYKAIAEREKKKARATLEKAAKEEKKAATLVNTVAANSLKRGLDKALSTKNLKNAAVEAENASEKVELAVKHAVSQAQRQKDRLKQANEKVDKAGLDARKEAEEKNSQIRREAYDTKVARERSEKAKTKEIQTKKEHANEAAHKAIVRVVTKAGKKASRKAARATATLIQQSFVKDACHRKSQHRMRLVGKEAKKSVAARGLSASAQTAAEVKAMQSNDQKVVDETVTNTVRRQAHLSAMGAKKQASARGLSNARQLDSARKAWKAAAPKIEGLCKPAAKQAAAKTIKNPGQAPEKINQHAFVVKAVQAMKGAVTDACSKATRPVVIEGAKLAAKHDADYTFQVTKGIEEAYKVCNATVALYNRNAELMSKKMVTRSFDEDADEKQKSTLFAQRIREDAENKVKGAEKAAGRKTKEKMNKQCEKKTNLAKDAAKNEAARAAVGNVAKGHAEEKAKAAYDKAYQEALDDGLSVARAKKLADYAKNEAYTNTQATAQEATSGLAPAPPAVPTDLAQLRAELDIYRSNAVKKRANEAKHKKQAVPSTVAIQMEQEASDAESDAKKVELELQHTELEIAAQEIAVPTELLMSVPVESLSPQDQAEKKASLVHAIAKAVRSLHHLGGRLPSEIAAFKLQTELQEAKARIAELEAR